MAKTITVTLGGKERELDFGKWYFTKYLGEAMKGDPLNVSVDMANTFLFSVAIVYAGLMCHCKVNKLEADFTFDDVEFWVGSMEVDEIRSIEEKYALLQEGEKKNQPETEDLPGTS